MNLYLILHKVRGKPAFDVAERCEDLGTETDPGPWWIIPTSGHRAFPCIHWELSLLKSADGYNSPLEALAHHEFLGLFAQIPDHYPTVERRKPTLTLEDLGL